MPKHKTKKAAAKRLKVTGTGKIRRHKAGAGHLMAGKTRKRKRNLRAPTILGRAEHRRVKDML